MTKNYVLKPIYNDENECTNDTLSMHSKYDNMHKNGMFYALICINNRIIAC